MCSSTLEDIVDAGVSAGQAVESGVNTIVNAAGDIIDDAGNVVGSVASQVTDPSVGGASNFGLKPLSFLPPRVEDAAVDIAGDALELQQDIFVDPIVDNLISPIITAPFNTALGAVSDLALGAGGAAGSVLGQAGGFYPNSDQLGGIKGVADSGPVKAQYDPRGADFLADRRDKRFLNTRSTLLTGSQGVTGKAQTNRNQIFGKRRDINVLGG